MRTILERTTTVVPPVVEIGSALSRGAVPRVMELAAFPALTAAQRPVV